MFFWLVACLWLLFGLWIVWPSNPSGWNSYTPLIGNMLVFVLFVLLGWKVYAHPIRGSVNDRRE